MVPGTDHSPGGYLNLMILACLSLTEHLSLAALGIVAPTLALSQLMSTQGLHTLIQKTLTGSLLCAWLGAGDSGVDKVLDLIDFVA